MRPTHAEKPESHRDEHRYRFPLNELDPDPGIVTPDGLACSGRRSRRPLENRILRECQPWVEPAGMRLTRTNSESCKGQDAF
jgi:hypothetical protein